MTEQDAEIETALSPGLPRRLMAAVYDTFLVLPIIMLGVAMGMGLYAALTHMLGGTTGDELLGAWAVRGIEVLVVAGFFTAFWRKSGQTLGMQAWRIKLVPLPGKRLTAGRCMLRCAAALLSAACLGIGYLWCLVDRNGRYWHDYLSGTTLVMLPKKAGATTK
ncbi:MAG: RDD family protein [Chromatocurvus sp.]